MSGCLSALSSLTCWFHGALHQNPFSNLFIHLANTTHGASSDRPLQIYSRHRWKACSFSRAQKPQLLVRQSHTSGTQQRGKVTSKTTREERLSGPEWDSDAVPADWITNNWNLFKRVFAQWPSSWTDCSASSAPEGPPGVAGACLIYHRTLRDTFTACFSNTRREISSPVSAFVSVRLCRLSSLHFNFYTFLNQDRCSRRRDFLSFTSSSLKSATYITDDAVCSSTQSPSTHMFCGFVPSSTLRIPPVEFQNQATEFNGFVDFLF